MDDKQRKIVMASVGGGALLVAAVLIVRGLFPGSPPAALAPEQEAAFQETVAQMEKASEEATLQYEAQAEPEAVPEGEPLEHKVGRMYRPKK